MIKCAEISLLIEILLRIGFVINLLSKLIGEDSAHRFDDSVTCTTIPSAVTSIDIDQYVCDATYHHIDLIYDMLLLFFLNHHIYQHQL